MHRALPIVAFVGLLTGWLVALFILALTFNDALYWLAGRQRWCGLAINAGFSFLVVFVGWRIRRRKIALFAALGAFLVIVVATDLWIPFVAAFGGPPWAAKVVKGPPLSAATPYMWDAWAWSLPGGDRGRTVAPPRLTTRSSEQAGRVGLFVHSPLVFALPVAELEIVRHYELYFAFVGDNLLGSSP